VKRVSLKKMAEELGLVKEHGVWVQALYVDMLFDQDLWWGGSPYLGDGEYLKFQPWDEEVIRKVYTEEQLEKAQK